MIRLLQQPTVESISNLYRFAVPKYLELSSTGFFGHELRTELIHGYIFVKPSPCSPPHDWVLQTFLHDTFRLLPSGWRCRIKSSIVMTESVPEPGAFILRGGDRSFQDRFPTPEDVGLLVEIADTSLEFERRFKYTLYASEGVPCYWIINLIDNQIEVYTEPSREAEVFQSQAIYLPGKEVPVVLDGQEIARIPVDDLLPRRAD